VLGLLVAWKRLQFCVALFVRSFQLQPKPH